MKKLILFFVNILTFSLTAQTTVGVLSVTEEVSDGYTFFSPFSGTKAYMVDNCGNLVNEWDRGTRPGLSAYFLENGLMMRTYKLDPNGPFTSASNAGGIELIDWDNNVVWRYEINTAEQLSHHDAVMIPNGNILILTWELTFRDELVELGRDPNEIAVENFMWSEKILELEPVGTNDANIVWEWHINDHYIQDFDSTKVGFGVVSDHPELFDINQPDLNSGNSNETRDWNHFNAIDYNPNLDQILISVRNSDEIWILDHSTTTEEAASHSGGVYGQGGDILYRWGNASAYQGAPISEQKLYGQHGINWIQDGLDDAGQILIFNNGNGKPGVDFSQIQILTPPQSSSGFYIRDGNEPFGPENNITIYGDLSSERFYSAFLSNALRLTNGNTLINEGSPGKIFEITPDREIVWEYEIPLIGDFPATQGQNVNNNSSFRAYKYPPDYPGFEGIELIATEPIETNPNPCQLMTNVNDIIESKTTLNYNASLNALVFSDEWSDIKNAFLYSVDGQLLQSFDTIDEHIYLKNKLSIGIYFVTLIYSDNQGVTQKVFIK